MFAKLALVSALLAAVVGGVTHPSEGAAPSRSYVVEPGDTLWGIADRYYDGDPRKAVWMLRERNGPEADTLEVGETLLLP